MRRGLPATVQDGAEGTEEPGLASHTDVCEKSEVTSLRVTALAGGVWRSERRC